MRAEKILKVSAFVILIAVLFVPFLLEDTVPESPRYTDDPGKCEGTGHTFGKGILYTIGMPLMCDGKERRKITSHEPDVVIVSMEKVLMAAPIGSKFELTEDGFHTHPR